MQDESTWDDVVIVPLRDRQRVIQGFALIDGVDAERVMRYKWHQARYRRYARKSELVGDAVIHTDLHEFVLDFKGSRSELIDHINGSGFDNRRCNLRIVPQASNTQNRCAIAGKSSKYRGVDFHKPSGKWRARVGKDGRSHSIGYYTSEDAAGRAVAAARPTLLPYSNESRLPHPRKEGDSDA